MWMTRAMCGALAALSTFALTTMQQPRESASCQSDIVSSTVVATFCGHREGNNIILDLLILWRGQPGWFHWKGTGTLGSGGSRAWGRGTKGVVSYATSYGDVTIAFDVNFDMRVATVSQATIELDRANTVIVDDVDEGARITATRWTDPALPLAGDWNLALARRSSPFVRDLQCSIPMPVPPPAPQPPVLTVCEKLKKQ